MPNNIAKTVLATILNKRDRFLLRTFVNQLTTIDLPHVSAIHNTITSVLHKDHKEASIAYKTIELQRSLLNKNHKPLVDGSFDVSGLYDQGLTISEVNKASKTKFDCEILGFLAYYTAPKTILELGTNTGISSAYLSILLDHNPSFNLTTLDASPYRQRVAKGIHENLGIKNIHYVTGLFNDTLKPVLQDNKTYDFVFIDGHHQYQPTLDYFDVIYPYCNKNAVIVFDDISWSSGMKKAWEDLKKDTRFLYCVDLHKIGVCILGENDATPPQTFSMRKNN